MWEPVQRYRTLDPESRRIFWRALILLPMVRASLRLRGYNRTYVSLQKKLHPEVGLPSGSAKEVEKTSRMVRVALRYSPARFTCLEQSLTLWYLLRKQGIATQLRIGVRKMDGKFEAHAWVEHQGVALQQPGEIHRHYAAFDREFSDVPAEKP